MYSERKVPVVLCWHMHQPDYRDAATNRIVLPWVLLRSLKDYADMAAHLEAAPQARVVVNFSPVLLDQIENYARQLRDLLQTGVVPADPLLEALVKLPDRGATSRGELVASCIRDVTRRMAARTPGFERAAERAGLAIEQGRAADMEDDALVDLLVRYFLCWCGTSVRIDSRWAALAAQDGRYDSDQRRTLLRLIDDVMQPLLSRYAALAHSGRVELSMSPYYHPLAPLLVDFAAAREAAPQTVIPQSNYPDGANRLRWHLRQGVQRFEEIFGRKPAGCWPSEAALSQGALQLMSDEGFRWTASSQSVLQSTMRRRGSTSINPYQMFRTHEIRPRMFFRDDALSDRIGFLYKDWHAHDAVADLLQQLEQIALRGASCIAIILDGENPWDWYSASGADFIAGLYRGLCAHSSLRMATFADCLDDPALACAELPPLVSGSWVHGELLTWIGHPEKNRAWQLLIDAKRHFDASPRDARLQYLLGACEGSDWFWWPGSAHPPPSVASFDHLFRLHLRNLYRAMDLAAES